MDETPRAFFGLHPRISLCEQAGLFLFFVTHLTFILETFFSCPMSTWNIIDRICMRLIFYLEFQVEVDNGFSHRIR